MDAPTAVIPNSTAADGTTRSLTNSAIAIAYTPQGGNLANKSRAKVKNKAAAKWTRRILNRDGRIGEIQPPASVSPVHLPFAAN
jgi:hypothetical protein